MAHSQDRPHESLTSPTRVPVSPGFSYRELLPLSAKQNPNASHSGTDCKPTAYAHRVYGAGMDTVGRTASPHKWAMRLGLHIPMRWCFVPETYLSMITSDVR